MTATPKPQTGMWILTAPNGKQWQADSPLKVCGAEQRERVPARVGLPRIFAAIAQPEQAALSKTTIENLHKFLDASAGDGVISGGVDAADLYIEIFPEQYAEGAK